MARADDDSWDIATSVGATAVMVAMARAAETSSDHPLIRDEYAEPLVSTPALAEVRERIASLWRRPEESEDPAAGLAMDFQHMIDYQAVRTHFFDEYFAAAAESGIRQVVILAAGLDSRAYRLNWPAGTVLYEIDLPAVLEYKSSTLDSLGAAPATTRREVAVDLRGDWPGALRAAGFNPAVPTAWLAEGLLPFLPGQAQEAMFTAIDGLSAAGSRIAVEVFGVDKASRLEVEEQWRQRRAEREQRGEDVLFDPLELWYDDSDRPECADWFTAHGWTTRAVHSRDEFERLGRPPSLPADEPQHFVNSLVTAERPRQPVG
jgi:methyltransferase (TIGR00027 family)